MYTQHLLNEILTLSDDCLIVFFPLRSCLQESPIFSAFPHISFSSILHNFQELPFLYLLLSLHLPAFHCQTGRLHLGHLGENPNFRHQIHNSETPQEHCSKAATAANFFTFASDTFGTYKEIKPKNVRFGQGTVIMNLNQISSSNAGRYFA